MKFENVNLLIISDRYPHENDTISSSFVKSQVDCLSGYFKSIYVISLTPLVPKCLSAFSFMNPRWKRDAFANNYEYGNIKVHFAKHFTLPFDFSRKKRGDVAFNVVYKIIKNSRIEFDLIHAHFTYPSGYVSAKLKEIYNRPIVLTVHEDRDSFLNEINDRNAVYTWNNVDKIIRVNKSDLKEFCRSGIDESKLISLPNGVSPKVFKPMDSSSARIALGLPIDKNIILNIANLEDHKGQRYLIKSMKSILDTHRDVILYIVGQGTLKRHLQLLIDTNDLQNNVILAGGNKPAEELPLWMNACDVFVLPSLSESFGIVQIEAMACGKPVVATINGGSEEIIINDRLGILVEPKDPEALAQAILRALEAEWDAEYIREHAQQFTWDKIADKILNVYREVLR
ncbi:MAG TPA: glycosyltransferase family 4 protein [Methanothrix sp.]|nr:glycosyltransferase family 4 protein [Methanothrix sp.]HPJ83235.1 glycosyltransferase family 4 protein [Methanothrix sp.]